MKLIINTVNLKIGGAFQRAISFLTELKEIGLGEYHIFLNNDIGNQLDIKSYPGNFKFYFFEHSPASLKYRRKVTKEFDNLVESVLIYVISPTVSSSKSIPSYNF